MRVGTILVRVGLLVVLFGLAASLGSADLPDQGTDGRSTEGVGLLATVDDQPYQYMVKFLCGWEGPTSYFTHINIHNYTPANLRIWVRPALYYAPGAAQLPVVPGIASHVIRPRRVMRIHCEDIWDQIGMTWGDYAEGMVHIGVGQKLPVVAVYQTFRDDDMTGETWEEGPDVEVNEYQPFIEP